MPSTIAVSYIRVDHKFRVFLARSPAVAKVNTNGIVQDIVDYIRRYNPLLGAIDIDEFKVYKLRKPVEPLPLRSSDSATQTTEDFFNQMSLLGFGTPYLEQLALSADVSEHFDSDTDPEFITVVIYHPVFSCPYEEEMYIIPKPKTFKTARINDLQKLSKTAPWDTQTNRKKELRHLFGGSPHSRHSWPVALYDPVLALLAHKLDLKRLDNDAEAVKYYPDAQTFRDASNAFLRGFSNYHQSGADRGEATFPWLQEIFPGRILDGEVLLDLPDQTSATEDSTDSLTGVVATTVGETKFVNVIIQVREQEEDAVFQSAKWLARYNLTLLSDELFDYTHFPTLVVTAEESMLRVSALVSNGTTIVSEVHMFHVRCSVFDCRTISRLERIASALRACHEQLAAYYGDLAERKTREPHLARQIRFPQPTLDPSEVAAGTPAPPGLPFPLLPALENSTVFKRLEITAFLPNHGEEPLEWIGKDIVGTERAWIMRGLYAADAIYEDDSKIEVAIKFATTYNAAAHQFLGEKNAAPRLYECRRVLGGLYMVVMDRVKGRWWSELGQPDAKHIEDLRQVVSDFHGAGYVNGNIRESNVMVSEDDGKVKITEFEWAAREGEGYYPNTLNMKNVKKIKECHPDISLGVPITKAHDQFALGVLTRFAQ